MKINKFIQFVFVFQFSLFFYFVNNKKDFIFSFNLNCLVLTLLFTIFNLNSSSSDIYQQHEHWRWGKMWVGKFFRRKYLIDCFLFFLLCCSKKWKFMQNVLRLFVMINWILYTFKLNKLENCTIKSQTVINLIKFSKQMQNFCIKRRNKLSHHFWH